MDRSVVVMDRSAELGSEVAKWVKDTAERRGISLRSIADAAFIPWPTFHRRLSGVTHFTVVELDRIARYLGTTTAAVLEEIEGQAA